jgi:hypothetical protein
MLEKEDECKKKKIYMKVQIVLDKCIFKGYIVDYE